MRASVLIIFFGCMTFVKNGQSVEPQIVGSSKFVIPEAPMVKAELPGLLGEPIKIKLADKTKQEHRNLNISFRYCLVVHSYSLCKKTPITTLCSSLKTGVFVQALYKLPTTNHSPTKNLSILNSHPRL